jgi:hypothetical protein
VNHDFPCEYANENLLLALLQCSKLKSLKIINSVVVDGGDVITMGEVLFCALRILDLDSIAYAGRANPDADDTFQMLLTAIALKDNLIDLDLTPVDDCSFRHGDFKRVLKVLPWLTSLTGLTFDDDHDDVLLLEALPRATKLQKLSVGISASWRYFDLAKHLRVEALRSVFFCIFFYYFVCVFRVPTLGSDILLDAGRAQNQVRWDGSCFRDCCGWIKMESWSICPSIYH